MRSTSSPVNLPSLPALLAVILGTFLSGCSYQVPLSETPAPNEFRLKKSFFADLDSAGNVIRYKTFACSWTPEKVAGRWGDEVFAFYNKADHCNIIFKPTADALVGKLINPSFPNDPDRWPNVISIPISKHFYYEAELDKYGRPTNRMIENSDRDDWSVRPYINIEPRGVRIKEWAYELFWDSPVIDEVTDFEQDQDHNFLAFTVEAHSSVFGSRMQGKFRFNFLEFKHDTSFVKTPYSIENSKHLNVLHILGEKVNGNRPILYAAHWDTRKKQKIYLNNFPSDLVGVAKDVIREWNDAFEAIGHGRPFEAEIRRAKYAIDLRYPGITWVADPYLSLNAPLGVGMANADVKNGKILWGGVTIWGGMLEKIVNAYTPAMHASSSQGEGLSEYSRSSIQLSLMAPKAPFGLLTGIKQNAIPSSLIQPLSMASARESLRNSILQRKQAAAWLAPLTDGASTLSREARNQIIRDVISNRSPLLSPALAGKATAEDIRAFTQSVQGRLSQLSPLLDSESGTLDLVLRDFSEVQGRLQSLAMTRGAASDFLTPDFLQSLIDQPTLASGLKSFPTLDAHLLKHVTQDGKHLSAQDLRKHIEQTQASGAHHASFDFDRRLSDTAYQWNAALASKQINKTAALRAMVKDLLLHEVGHMLGMGHNFKENILPERGSVPSKYLDGPNGLIARSKDGFKNYTTVMGYKNGITDILTRYEELSPGPNDLLVLRYLYNRQYPLFPVDARDEDDFRFITLDPESDGIIESRQTIQDASGKERVYRAAFFPSCNDLEASFGTDPYCNRWDRGSDAVSLVDGYFDDYRGLLSSQLYTFANNLQRRAHWDQEYYLWSHSLRTFGRARLFYDYMRQKYEATLAEMQNSVGSQQRIQNLLDFSEGCRGDTNNQSLKDLFAQPKNRELKELCIAVGNLFEQLQAVLELPGPDSTRIDYFDSQSVSAVFGGDANANYNKFFGTWKEIARNPLKIAALLAMTSPHPFNNFDGWVVPIYRYSRHDGSYLLNTFYPKEFAKTIASTVDHNLTFANMSLEDRTRIGRPVLALGYFLMNNFFSNDALSMDQPYIKNIRDQTEFNYSLVAIEVERKPEEGKEIARKFSATIHNFYSSRGPESVPEFYIYTNDRTISSPPARSLLYPLTRIRWYSASNGFYYAVKMDYPDDYYDRLKAHSVRQSLESMYYQTMTACTQGSKRNGLRYFFNDNVSPSVFPGFTFSTSIHKSTTDKNKFFQSVEDLYERYYSNKDELFSEKPDPRACEEALRGQGLLVLAASAINGSYLWDLYDYIEKGD